MKVSDFKMMESIVNVPSKWIENIARMYVQPVKYAYATWFTDNKQELDELLSKLDYLYTTLKRDSDIINNKAKLMVLSDAIPLSSPDTFINDTEIMVVVQFNTSGTNNGSYSYHPKYGHMIIINIAAAIIEGSEKSDDDVEAVQHAMNFLKVIIEHELVHLIEHEQGNKNQLKTNKNYKTNKSEYYKSPIEFNAMVVSIVKVFKNDIDALSQEDKTLLGYDNIHNALLKQLGDNKEYIPTGNERIDERGQQLFNDLSETNMFMYTLKNEKEKKWKKAVKMITTYFEKMIS